MRKRPEDWFRDYGVCHTNPINKRIHWICVPLIMLSLLGLLWNLPVPAAISTLIPAFRWTWALVAVCLVFYLLLSPALATGMAIAVAGCIGLIMAYEKLNFGPVWIASLIVFVIAWIGQFIGHKIEGQKPAFVQDLQFLLIGPIWLLAFIFRRLGIRY